ncbi:MAG: hypothetical protein AB1631_31055 [Acidobacteriota bacterium]
MKQRGVILSEGQAARLEEITDLDAWKGYEFWSAQVEDWMTNERAASYSARPEPFERERESDVLPF